MQEIYASHEEFFRPDLDKTKWFLSGFLHFSGYIEQEKNDENEVCFSTAYNGLLNPP